MKLREFILSMLSFSMLYNWSVQLEHYSYSMAFTSFEYFPKVLKRKEYILIFMHTWVYKISSFLYSSKAVHDTWYYYYLSFFSRNGSFHQNNHTPLVDPINTCWIRGKEYINVEIIHISQIPINQYPMEKENILWDK